VVQVELQNRANEHHGDITSIEAMRWSLRHHWRFPPLVSATSVGWDERQEQNRT